jgi:glycosyltransferase involved in cell wall biosynthesis
MGQAVTAAISRELVSVVMPCFNALPFVEQAVRSALGQDYGNVELIVVDDGSSDGSQDILAGLVNDYGGRMTVLHQDNQGPYPARNAGLERARGNLVAFLDADDYWSGDCLGKLHSALQATQANLAYCGWQNVGDGAPGKNPYVPPEYERGDMAALFLKGCPWPIHAALLRRSVIEQVSGFSTRMFSSMDYDLWLRILAVTRNIVRVPEVLAFYRWHDQGQISSVKWRQVMHAWQVRRDFVQSNPDLVAHLAPTELRELLDGPLLRAAYVAYWKRDLVSAQPLFRKAALQGFWHVRDAKFILTSLLPSALYRRLVAAADRQ